VPNQHISFRNSWFGSLIAAVAVSIYLYLFPFYVTHFLRNDTGQVGFAVILLFFFYYFAVIMLVGAEINAFFAEGVQSTPEPLTTMVHQYTSHLPTTKEAIQQQAPPSHKNEVPKEIRPKNEGGKQEDQASETVSSQREEHARPASSNHTNHARRHEKKDRHQPASPGTSTPLIVVEALAGTALAFVLQFFNIKRKK
jgi:Virulence factor BrkB